MGTIVFRSAAGLALGAGLGMAMTASVHAQNGSGATEERGGIRQVTVTAQRTAENVQTVPIAVTALSGDSLGMRQVENFSDLQFNIPNTTFSKGNFTGSSFQIRGVGTTLVASSSDNGVGININDVPLNAPRLFETDLYDVERVEVLRGPQGTLFGRNATAGVVNMHTAKPVLEEFQGSAEFEYGNFDSTRAEAMLNIPVGEKVAIRLAGNFVKRDGYTRNLDTGNRIDGRDNYSLRGSVRIEPSDNTRIDFMISWFDEDSNRTRATKQLCHRDPTAILGCLPDSLAFESANSNATLSGILMSNAVLGPLALTNLFDPTDYAAENPANLRQTRAAFDPIYQADELLMTLQIEQDLGENYTLTFTGGYQDTHITSQQEYFNRVDVDPVLPAAVGVAFPITSSIYFANGMFPISGIDDSNFGVVGGNIAGFSSDLPSYDQSNAEAEQYSAELRLNSNYDGPFNFQAGAFYMKYDYASDYYVIAASLDYFALVGSGIDGVGLVSPFYRNETETYELESWAIFADATYDITDEIQLTAGIRYTEDKKFELSRQLLLDGIAQVGSSTAIVPLPTLDELRSDWGEVTGRAVVTWTPRNDAMYYASYSRGYKGGGFNPPSGFSTTATTFDPEFIDAYEIGTKQTFADGRAQANISAFYYDYQNLQISKIVDRTSLNENIDVKTWGLEGEFLYAPNENWMFNLNASYMGSKIGDEFSVDGRDPTDGRSDVTLIKDLSNASNCVINHNGAPPPELIPELAALFPFGTTEVPGLDANAAFTTCDGAAAALAGFNQIAGTNYTVTDGVEASLKGNEIQQAPDFTISMGAQYTHYFGNGMSLSTRVDYYMQTAMFARLFNKPIDRIKSWDVLNAQVTLNSANDTWRVRAFIQNIANSKPITGHFFTDPSSGNFTNVFVLEPRRFGIEVGASF